MSFDPQQSDLSTLDMYTRRGVGLAKLAPDYLKLTGDFLDNPLAPGWTSSLGGGAVAAVLVTGVSGGHSNLITTTGVGGLCAQNTVGSAGIANLNSTQWYCAWRQKLPLAITANTRCGSGFFNGAATVFFGAYGNLSLTNFVLQYNGLRAGSALTFGVADTNMHVCEVWQPGDGNIYACMDQGAIQIGVAPNNANAWPYSEAYNNGSATDQQLTRDWFVYLSARS
jgi:hypothetical protein